MKNSKTQLTLHIFKQNFRFSAAHFLIFDEKRAERLHGHNYQVQVNLAVPPESELMNKGYFIDFKFFKNFIKRELDFWNEVVLLPKLHPDMKIKTSSTNHEIQFRDRTYSFPIDEVRLLEINNTSVEELSGLLANKFLKEFSKYGVSKVRVMVEETRGQAASTTIKI